MSVIPPSQVVRDYLNDSRVWKDFMYQGGFVEGDIIVADPFKAGTTFSQRIIQQILSNGKETEANLSDSSPWLDSSWGNHSQMLAILKEQQEAGQRRVIKSHLPASALPIDSKARYIFVGRNGKDLGISFHHYLRSFKEKTMEQINQVYATWNETSESLVIPEDVNAFFDLWLDHHGYGCCDLFAIVKSWWSFKDNANVLLLHYQEMIDDLPQMIRQIASFIDIDPSTLSIDLIAEQCSFKYMKNNAEKMAPFGGGHMTNATAFFQKGPERDFRTELHEAQIEKFDTMALKELGEECAAWLEHGGAGKKK